MFRGARPRSQVAGGAREQVNVDRRVAEGFGDEWERFDQTALPEKTRAELFESYFRIFPWQRLPEAPLGADFGCGSGRWAMLVAPRVGKLYVVDASEQALGVARRNLAPFANCIPLHASVSDAPIPDESLDFAYSLGVLHHIPDTAAGLRNCVKKLKPGAPFLVYLYYRLDDRPAWFRLLWRISNLGRVVISRLPQGLRYWVSQGIAALVYWPLARTARLLERCGLNARHFPLHFYRDQPFYVMRTDALDRFGTSLERRFSRVEIESMMGEAGLESIEFSDRPPFWCAVGYRRRN